MKAKITLLPHAGHFIDAHNCKFRLNHVVNNKYVISTVGAYCPPLSNSFEEVGYGRMYETMVFEAKKCNCGIPGCYMQEDGNNIDFVGYKKVKEAYKGHFKMLKKWSKKK